MGDDQGRAALHQHFEGVLHRAFAFAVQRRSGFVEDQHRGVLVDRAGDGQALALAAGELAGVVAEHGLQALRQGQRKIEQVRALQGRQHALAIDAFIFNLTECDVGRHRVVEQHHVLADQRKLAPQRVDAPLAQRHAIEPNLAVAGFQKARQQVDQRCLAGARGPHQCHGFAGSDRQVQIGQGRGRIVAIGQAHRTQIDRPPHALAGHETAALLLRAELDQIDAALKGRQAARQRPGAVRQVFERRHQHQHRGDEGRKAADRGAAAAAAVAALQ